MTRRPGAVSDEARRSFGEGIWATENIPGAQLDRVIDIRGRWVP